jgi:hypothetical protein
MNLPRTVQGFPETMPTLHKFSLIRVLLARENLTLTTDTMSFVKGLMRMPLTAESQLSYMVQWTTSVDNVTQPDCPIASSLRIRM